MSSYDVIVVGCGAAGVSALATLARAGCNVLGLEAANRVGGRIKTVEFGRGVVELGAECNLKIARALILALLVGLAWQFEQTFLEVILVYLDMSIHRSDGTEVNKNTSEELINYCFHLMESPPKDHKPLGKYITRNFREYISKMPSLVNDKDFINEFLEFMNLLVNNHEASNDWDDVTTASNYEELEGHQHWSWHAYGYRTLFDILLNKYKNGTGLPVDIQLGKEVTSIQWSQQSGQKVTVKCKDGSMYTTNTVIVTLSLGVLKERHAILFDPKLPQEKIDAINCMSMGVMDKIIFAYETIWWPSNLTFFGFVWRGVDKARVPAEDAWTTKIYGFSSPLGSENSITLWTSGEAAKLVETLPEDVVKRKCTELLRKFMGPRVMEPVAMIRVTTEDDVSAVRLMIQTDKRVTISRLGQAQASWVFAFEELPTKVKRGRSAEKNMVTSFLGITDHYATIVVEAKKIVTTDWSTWYSNPLTRGSYTFDGVQTADGPAARAALAAPLRDRAGVPRLLFAGEATNQKHFSTVHGAIETGIREAESILNSLGLNSSRTAEASSSTLDGIKSKIWIHRLSRIKYHAPTDQSLAWRSRKDSLSLSMGLSALPTQQESYNRPLLALHDESWSLAAVYNWFNEFKRGRTNLTDDLREGRPSTATT
ncbi:Spermine oxidase [Eumeta japonica]|uniref:Spermine oxidase n=1 Tax=Eumeta variegata TaxID=151549 RepID=A0A4C1T9S9_EUMVA|nr:Spermine oxidase [Eumeta japonica]